MSESDYSGLRKPILWKRRQLLKAGLLGAGILGGAITLPAIWPKSQQPAVAKIPPVPSDPQMLLLRDFDYGTVKQEKGRTVREFRLVAGSSTVQLNSIVSFNTWNVNGRVPGPTLRVTEGDRVRILFYNKGGHAHSLHFHGIHRPEVDGVKPIADGAAAIYEFDAEPYGVHLYHCHVPPISRHVSKGLYGMFIIDPPQKRPPADEMVMIMAGYDTNDDNRNELYAFNGMPDYYMMHPIQIYQNQLIRLYVLNMIEFDPAATFHLHANMFQVYPTGRTLTPTHDTDVITMGTAERHILEFSCRYPGKYMFHPHQDYMAENGCMGEFEVI